MIAYKECQHMPESGREIEYKFRQRRIPKRRPSEDNRQYAYRAIREEILMLDLPPGERLREVELATLLCVSRTPVHDAIERLRLDGLADSVPNRGAVVSALNPENISNCLWLLDIFCCDVISSFFTNKVSKEQIAILNFLLAHVEEAVKENDSRRYARLIADFFQQFFTLGGQYNLVWTGLSRTYSDIYRLNVLIAESSGAASSLTYLLRQMTHALSERKSDKAAFYIRKWLLLTEKLIPQLQEDYPDYWINTDKDMEREIK